MVTTDDRQSFSQRLNEALDDREFPRKGKGRQTALGQKYGVSQKGARKWLEGESIPRHATLVRMARDLNVRFEWLAAGTGPKKNETERVAEPRLAYADTNVIPISDNSLPTQRWVPLVRWDAAERWRNVESPYPPDERDGFKPVTKQVSENSFALRVQGDSMEPVFPPGSIIVVDPDAPPRNGSFVVVRLNGADEPTFKQLVIDGHQRYLKPLNPRYPVQALDDAGTICGVVRQMTMDFDT